MLSPAGSRAQGSCRQGARRRQEARVTPPGLSALAAELRAGAPERFLTALFAPTAVREAVMALGAFEAATAKAVTSSQALAGLGRLSFWREAIATAADGRTLAHPAADALRRAILAHELPWEPFDAHLAAREAMLTQGAFPDMADLSAHARDLAQPLLVLSCRVLGGAVPPGTDAAATALGLVDLLRSAVALARAGRLALPENLCADAGFGVQSLAEGRGRGRIAPVVAQVAERAREPLKSFRPPRAAIVAFLGLVPARSVLRTLERANFDPVAAAMWRPGTGLRLSVLWAALLGWP